MKKVALMTLVSAALLLGSCGSHMATGAYTGASLGGMIGSAVGSMSGGYRGSSIGTVVGAARNRTVDNEVWFQVSGYRFQVSRFQIHVSGYSLILI